MHTLRPKRTLAIHQLECLDARIVPSTVNPASEAIVVAKGGQALGAIYKSFEETGAVSASVAQANHVVIKGTSVGIDVHVRGNFQADKSLLQGLGMNVTATSPKNGTIEGFLPIAQLPTVASSTIDIGMSPIYKPTTKAAPIHKTIPAVSTSHPTTTVITVSHPTTTVTPTHVATPAASPNPSTSIVASKGGPALASIYQEYLNFEQAGGTGTFSPPEARQIIIKGTSVGVDIRVAGNLAASVAQFQNLGMQVTVTTVAGQVGIIEGMLPISQLPTVAGDSSVVGLGPIYRPTLR